MNFENLSPSSILFFVFSGISVGSALAVVLHKNPVISAASLVLSFFALAGIYAVMNALFIATMQVLVYAGAIMVLVVFVIMLLSLREETNQEIWKKPIKQGFIVLLVLSFGFLLVSALNYSPEVAANASQANGTSKGAYSYNLKSDPNTPVIAKGNTATVGASTFIDYLLPFELVSVLLLAAVVGAVVIAKRDKLRDI
ncbi:MAG: NADH-quinone oxidoreductase subunit J [Leptospiraceae bacterium]|nr:NADH-quinone oxidoreductase subunit J [Leptospiraceae bacterium]